MLPIPKEIVKPLLAWYRSQARVLPWREEPTPYRVWVSEIMLQQTRVEAVKPYFERFMDALPDVSALAQCDEARLLKLWEGLGYYHRARNLQRAAQIMQKEHGGHVPADFSVLLSLPGIGRYTAGAISSIAYGKKQAAVDGNVLRVVMRLLACPDDILKDKTKREVEDGLIAIMPSGGEDAGAFNQALMELGAMVCLPKGTPKCASCPWKRLCLAYAEDCIDRYPQKAKKKPRRQEKLTVLLIEREGKIAIHQRPRSGLLAGLWEFPNLPGHYREDELKQILFRQGLFPATMYRVPDAKHIFSHVEWHMQGWRIRLPARQIHDAPSSYFAAKPPDAGLPPLRWATRADLHQDYSIPSAFHGFFPALDHGLDDSPEPS